MNKNDFLEIMGSQKNPDAGMIAELAELTALFPYFQSAHMLLLRGLKKNEDVRFSAQLRKSALYIADREVLYNFLNEPETVTGGQDALREQDSVNTAATDVKAEPETIQPIDITGAQDQIHVQMPEEVISESQAEVEHNAMEAAETMAEAPEEVAEEIIPAATDENAVASESGDEEVIDLLELDTEKQDTEVTDDALHSEELTEDDTVRLSQADLIDKFIIANPRIEPNRERKEVPVEDRSVPVYDQSGFVTETLAGIYVSQGYYSRAIDIFEKLALKFPEKSSYFAAQIEKVKEYIKK